LILSSLLVVVTIADYLRFNFPTIREIWETNFGFLMRESERDKINGVVYYLIGVIFVLVAYPREIAVVSILT
jgi:diacylglycerol kinase (CTP)